MEDIVKRFLRYVTYDTQSDDLSTEVPSTPGQMRFLELLRGELAAMGLEEITLDGAGYLMATLPATTDEPKPVVGFLAHVDTSPDVSGRNVNPRVIEAYDGNDILLGNGVTMRTQDFPELGLYVGDRLVVTDGTTLLGADDKAGISIILDMAQYFLAHPEIPHGKVRIAFTPDEEIGRGMDRFDAEAFGADFAYTVDGGRLGELEYESFNAAEARILIQGRNVHPGSAKGKMINALEAAREIDSMVPQRERPQYTDGYEGFFHLLSLVGDVEKASMHYLVRDHSRELFEARKEKMRGIVAAVNDRFGKDTAVLEMKDQYYNMREAIEPQFGIVEAVIAKMRELGIEPIVRPIRGGTDGSRLSFMGVPCPNIFTGGENFHGRYEFVSCSAMEKASRLIVGVVRSL